jgi:L-serine deaminase
MKACGVETRSSGLRRALDVMRGAVERGLVGDLHSVSGLVGGDAEKLSRARPARRHGLYPMHSPPRSPCRKSTRPWG